MENNFKIGDEVRLPDWDDFYPITRIYGDSIRITQGDDSSWYEITLGFIKKEKEMEENQQGDEFNVGDTVWCIVYGKGEVKDVKSPAKEYPVHVIFAKEVMDKLYEHVIEFTIDGKLNKAGNRTLFFTEPKVEGSITRPFVPTLVGKTVAIYSTSFPRGVIRKVYGETHDKIFISEQDEYHEKINVREVYKVSSENLLKKD